MNSDDILSTPTKEINQIGSSHQTPPSNHSITPIEFEFARFLVCISGGDRVLASRYIEGNHKRERIVKNQFYDIIEGKFFDQDQEDLDHYWITLKNGKHVGTPNKLAAHYGQSPFGSGPSDKLELLFRGNGWKTWHHLKKDYKNFEKCELLPDYVRLLKPSEYKKRIKVLQFQTYQELASGVTYGILGSPSNYAFTIESDIRREADELKTREDDDVIITQKFVAEIQNLNEESSQLEKRLVEVQIKLSFELDVSKNNEKKYQDEIQVLTAKYISLQNVIPSIVESTTKSATEAVAKTLAEQLEKLGIN